jgi:Na+-transporting methylmalonyl-CoA/oxaloacetate decarboxylase gamma subunit
MNLNDAFVITGLGIGIVFTGLILTSLLIYAFSFFPNLFAKLKRKVKETEKIIEKPQEMKEVSPDIVAVLATIIEVEFRLKLSVMEGKFTYR